MPYLHPERRMAGAGALPAFDDELAILHAEGVRAVVSLLNIPSDAGVYTSAGFEFLCIPVADGDPPTITQANDFVAFVRAQQQKRHPVAVHCEAGIGRTGTLLTVFLIANGDSAVDAIRKVRAVEPSAVETRRQIQFLEEFEKAERNI
jgi:atypical dual specificity phosphatase